MTYPHPIETRYAGCRFRSRLEARWAVFFDHMGLKWEYEPEGLELPNGQRYLLDFSVTTKHGGTLRIEVKGSDAMLDADRLVEATANHIFFDKLLILGPVPRVDDGTTPLHWMIRRIAREPYLVLGYFQPDGHIMQWGQEYIFAPDAIGHIVDGRSTEDLRLLPEIRDAYVAARSARFEYGESG